MDSGHIELLALLVAVFGIPLTLLGIHYGRRQAEFAKRQTEIAEQALTSTGVRPRVEVLEQIRRKRTARIGYFHYPPFVCQNLEDPHHPSGLYVNLLRYFLRSEGIDAHFEPVNFRMAMDLVIEYELDIVLCIFETPMRRRFTDFCAFMHTVSVSGVVRRDEVRVKSKSDLMNSRVRVGVFAGEVGHEIVNSLYDLKDTDSRLTILGSWDIATIINLVATKSVDVAIADSLSCRHGLEAHGDRKPRMASVFEDHPLLRCYNGIMIGIGQRHLCEWLSRGLRATLAKPEFAAVEADILGKFSGIIEKV